MPSRWTVQAPHCAMPQPYLVPGQLLDVADHPEQRRVGIAVESLSAWPLSVKVTIEPLGACAGRTQALAVVPVGKVASPKGVAMRNCASVCLGSSFRAWNLRRSARTGVRRRDPI